MTVYFPERRRSECTQNPKCEPYHGYMQQHRDVLYLLLELQNHRSYGRQCQRPHWGQGRQYPLFFPCLSSQSFYHRSLSSWSSLTSHWWNYTDYSWWFCFPSYAWNIYIYIYTCIFIYSLGFFLNCNIWFTFLAATKHWDNVFKESLRTPSFGEGLLRNHWKLKQPKPSEYTQLGVFVREDFPL